MDKLEKLNLIPIEDFSASCGELEYIHIEDTEENRTILKGLGSTEEDLKEMASEGILDIMNFAWEKLGAEYWSQTDGFTYEKATNYKLKD